MRTDIIPTPSGTNESETRQSRTFPTKHFNPNFVFEFVPDLTLADAFLVD